jgi:hypothetical protein
MTVTNRGLLRRNRDFRRFWVGHTISVAGTHITAVALPLLATLTLDVGTAGVAAIAGPASRSARSAWPYRPYPCSPLASAP